MLRSLPVPPVEISRIKFCLFQTHHNASRDSGLQHWDNYLALIHFSQVLHHNKFSLARFYTWLLDVANLYAGHGQQLWPSRKCSHLPDIHVSVWPSPTKLWTCVFSLEVYAPLKIMCKLYKEFSFRSQKARTTPVRAVTWSHTTKLRVSDLPPHLFTCCRLDWGANSMKAQPPGPHVSEILQKTSGLQAFLHISSLSCRPAHNLDL